MRVIMLTWEYPPRVIGGISPHVKDLSNQLQAKGVEIHIVTKHTPDAPDEEIEANGIQVHRVRLAYEPHNFVHEIQLLNQATVVRASEILRDKGTGEIPTILHTHDWLSFDSARELKYAFNLPMLATVHATESGRLGGIFHDLSRYVNTQEYWLTYESWRVIVCSEYMKDEVRRQFACPDDKIDVIYNGVEASKFEFAWSDRERIAFRSQCAREDERIILYVGRFVREKGIRVLVDSAHAILAQEPRAKFVLIGGGDRAPLVEFVEWAGLRDHFDFKGFVSSDELLKFYRISDVAVFPSLYEPFGIVALEAMAAGIPVVASDAGGLKEVVLHDRTGTLSYANQPSSLAWAVLRVLQDPMRASELAKAAKARLASEFDWAKLADQTISVYDRVWREYVASDWSKKQSNHSAEAATTPGKRMPTARVVPVERPRPRRTR